MTAQAVILRSEATKDPVRYKETDSKILEILSLNENYPAIGIKIIRKRVSGILFLKYQTTRMKFLLGKKLAMTQVFSDNGRVVPVTRVQAGPCVVTQVVKEPKGAAVEIGFGEKKHITKPLAGHLKGLPAARILRRFRVEELPDTITRGTTLSVDMFKPGDRVAVSGTSKGKGFQGVVKRHHFAGAPASHGHKDQSRMPGSIGATGPQRVLKNTRMAGRMGGEQVTVSNLEVVSVDPEKHELLLKGAVPGATGSFLVICQK